MTYRHHVKKKGFQKNSKAWVRDYRGKNHWTQEEIVEQTGPVSYRVNLMVIYGIGMINSYEMMKLAE